MTGLSIGRPTLLPILAYGEPDQGYATHRVTSPFAPRADGFHAAIDVGNYRAGDVVTAVAAGTLHGIGALRFPWSSPASRWPSGNFGGSMVVLRHSPALWSVYAHLGRTVAAVAGTRIAAGSLVGLIGDTGSAAGSPHLHHAIVVATAAQLDDLAARSLTVPRSMCRDPWPLITGRELLVDPTQPDEDPDMPSFPTGFRHAGELLPLTAQPGARFRAAPNLTAAILDTATAGQAVPVHAVVPGQIVTGSPDWCATWRYIAGRGYTFGFFHRSTLDAAPAVDPHAAERDWYRAAPATVR